MEAEGPIRTCVACRTRHQQQQLLRVVRTPEGEICLDTVQHRQFGRGAYLCPREDCIRQSERRQALKRALHATMPAELLPQLRAEALRRTGC